MKIGIIADIYCAIREPFTSGLEKHTFLLAQGLAQRGHEVTVFTAGECDARLNAEMISPELIAVDQVHPQPGNPDFARRYVQVHAVYKQLMERLQHAEFDILHNNCPHYLPILMANTLPMPMVTALHAPVFTQLALAITTAGKQENLHYICLSKHHAQGWQPYMSQYSVIPNGIDLTRYHFSEQPGGYAFWFGRLVPEKGAHLAIKAAHAAGIPIRIAGPLHHPEYFIEEIEPLLSPAAVYLGHLGERQIISQLAGAMCSLFTPRWDEPFGLTLIESLACGTPVIAFARGATEEILTSDTGTLVPPDDIAAMAQAMKKITTLSRSACRTRAQSFSLDAMLTRYEETYLSMCSDNLANTVYRA